MGSEDLRSGAKVVGGRGGLAAVAIDSNGIAGELYLHGGHVTGWKPPTQDEVLFVSDKTIWSAAKAIRGGVPICFPWFGPKADQAGAPQHGFVRTREWKLERIEETPGGIAVEVSDSSDERTRGFWPFDYRITHRVTFGTTLKMELEVENSGPVAFTFEEAQHTYFRVGDVRQISVRGLDGEFIDKTDGSKKKLQTGAITFAGETDRVYLDTASSVVVEDSALKRRIKVSKHNSNATVIWNPWIEKARALVDLGDDVWQKMVCVESCNLQDSAVRLEPGQRHMMRTEVACESMERVD